MTDFPSSFRSNTYITLCEKIVKFICVGRAGIRYKKVSSFRLVLKCYLIIIEKKQLNEKEKVKKKDRTFLKRKKDKARKLEKKRFKILLKYI